MYVCQFIYNVLLLVVMDYEFCKGTKAVQWKNTVRENGDTQSVQHLVTLVMNESSNNQSFHTSVVLIVI